MLSVGIVGLPNVGKSTLFNALLKKQAALAVNYPFATIEPNVGVVPVPDERIEKLSHLVIEEFKGSKPEKIYTTVRFLDIAGLVKGASQGEGLGNQFLSHIREVDAIVQVVRNFSDENVIRSGSVDPKSDIEVVNTELILADLQTLENQKSKISRRKVGIPTEASGKDQSDKSKFKNLVIEKVKEQLNFGKLLSQLDLEEEEKVAVKDLNLLTIKPIIYVLNSDEAKVAELSAQGFSSSSWAAPGSDPSPAKPYQADAEPDSGQARMTVGSSDGQVIFVSAKLEAELSALSEEEQKVYLAELNIKESGLDKVIKKAYEILGLITFLTTGPKEVRAWTLRHGSTALRASGTIHSDFERGFIAAEVISCSQLLASGSRQKAKELGQIRLEGKEYIIKDGDVVEFRFSV